MLIYIVKKKKKTVKRHVYLSVVSYVTCSALKLVLRTFWWKKGYIFTLVCSVFPPTPVLLSLTSFSVYDSLLSPHKESLIAYWGCITETSYLNSWLKI